MLGKKGWGFGISNMFFVNKSLIGKWNGDQYKGDPLWKQFTTCEFKEDVE